MRDFEKCTFKVGDIVVYRPSQHGWGYEVMRSDRLVPGQEYLVKEVSADFEYIVVDQSGHPRGMVWTEFQPKPKLGP